MKKNTKQIILQTAIKLFNKNGYEAVSVLEIAKHLKMTRGNLTYHFKNKEVLLKTIVEEMWRKLEKERASSRQFPSFQNLHQEIIVFYKIQKDYAFIFLNTHILKHPVIKQKFRRHTRQAIQDNKATISFSIKNGNMKPEPFPGIYNNIAFITWMLSFYWFSQKIILGEKSQEDCEKMIWSILIPHFTRKGVKAFESFFGQEYLESLGEPFDDEIISMYSF